MRLRTLENAVVSSSKAFPLSISATHATQLTYTICHTAISLRGYPEAGESEAELRRGRHDGRVRVTDRKSV